LRSITEVVRSLAMAPMSCVFSRLPITVITPSMNGSAALSCGLAAAVSVHASSTAVARASRRADGVGNKRRQERIIDGFSNRIIDGFSKIVIATYI
jgi:hypothetical protein